MRRGVSKRRSDVAKEGGRSARVAPTWTVVRAAQVRMSKSSPTNSTPTKAPVRSPNTLLRGDRQGEKDGETHGRYTESGRRERPPIGTRRRCVWGQCTRYYLRVQGRAPSSAPTRKDRGTPISSGD